MVSICVPTYNGADYLQDCLESLLDQSYIDTEILIVDDGSTDGSLDIINEYAMYDDRIVLHQNENNLGLVGNCNKCISLASHDWIKFAFQDDLLLTNCVSSLLHAALEYDCPISLCNRRYVIDSSAQSGIKNYILNDLVKIGDLLAGDQYISPEQVLELSRQHLLMNIFGEPTSLLFNKAVCQNYGFYNPDLAQMVDYEFVMRIATQMGIAFVNESHVFFRIHGGNQTNVNRGDQRSEAKRLKIEYIDAALMLHDFVNGEHYGSLQEHADILQDYRNKYEAELLKGIDQIGTQKLTDLAKSYEERYPQIIPDILNLSKSFVKS